MIGSVLFDELIYVICWPSWAISEYYYAFFGYIDTLPLIGLCLIDIVCFDNAGILLCLLGCFASWATLPLGLICLLGYFASWATLPSLAALPLGLLCLLGYFASWATLPLGLLCLLGCFASWVALPLGLLCLLGCFALGCFASWAALPLGILCLLGCFASWATLPLGLYIGTLPLGLCLIDIVCFDNARILIRLLGYAITGHLFVCQMISYVNITNRDTL
jgi:hypothetical protein